jgi:hypothetical protein
VINGDREPAHTSDLLMQTAFLEFPADKMRQIGYALIDAIVERASSVLDLPTHTTGNRASMNAQPMEATPKSPTDVQAVIERVAHDDGHAPISTTQFLGKTVLRSAIQAPP